MEQPRELATDRPDTADAGEAAATGGGVGRRTFFRGAAAATAAGMLVRPGGAEAAKPPKPARGATWGHAVGNPRGSEIAMKVGRGAEGRFGFMLKGLRAYAPQDDLLVGLARSMADPRRMSPTSDPSDHDEWDNFDISGGYTFFGQFLDHDITRDPTPLPLQQTDPKGLKNFDTPFLDLGSVYGEGPDKSPLLYEPTRPGYLRVSEHDGLLDLPRAADGTAHLGDPRNDENLIVAQLHVAFLRFHNSLMDDGLSFAEAQRLTRWHYQWLVVHQFLTRVAGADVVRDLLSPSHRRYFRKHYRPKNKNKPMMPLEFSVCAYRFGHSMIRPDYEMNDAHTFPIFHHPDDGRDGLHGNRPVPPGARADWTYFFDVPGRERPDGHNFSRLIDTRLALPLHGLPLTVVGPAEPRVAALGERNLIRGKRLGLAAGQDVAAKLGERVLTNDELGLTDPRWGGKAPLWFYILKEAELLQGGKRLGPVGGMLVAGTILGFLAFDKRSYLAASPSWRPTAGDYTVGDFLIKGGMIWR